jgi:hypothetical protein
VSLRDDGDIEWVRPTTLPGVLGRIRAAEDAFAASPRFACSHLLAGTRPALLCSQHAGLGLMCFACGAAHCERHYDEPSDHECDNCGAHSEWIAPLTSGWTFCGEAMSPNGDTATFITSVMALSLGVCDACHSIASEAS